MSKLALICLAILMMLSVSLFAQIWKIFDTRITNDVFIAWWCVKQYFIILEIAYPSCPGFLLLKGKNLRFWESCVTIDQWRDILIISFIIYITCISWAIDSLSERMSPKFLVPNTFLKVVAASRRAEPL